MAKSSFKLADMESTIINVAGIDLSEVEYKLTPSNIDVLDYYNARYYNVAVGNNPPQPEVFPGVPMGKFLGIIGYTGAGKTTLAIQIALAITDPYEAGKVYHFDLENAYSTDRVAEITGRSVSDLKNKYNRLKPHSIEKIYNMVKELIKMKKAAMEDKNSEVWTTNPYTGEVTPVPTVIIIDTLAALQSGDVLDERTEFGSILAEGGAQAKLNNVFAQRLAGSIGEVNITIIWINHIRFKIAVGGAPKRKRLQYLGEDEATPGGEGFPQYTDYYIKVTACGKHDTSEGFCIDGKTVECVMLKTRTSHDGRKFKLVLSNNGMDNSWSNLQFLKDAKRISGAGGHLYIQSSTGESTCKFAQKNFKKLYESDVEFKRITDDTLYEEFIKIVPPYGASLSMDGDIEDDDVPGEDEV